MKILKSFNSKLPYERTISFLAVLLEDGEKKSTKWKTYQVGWNIMFGGIILWQMLWV